jgi:hypothetical protein
MKKEALSKVFFSGETASREEKINCKLMLHVLPPSRLFFIQELLRRPQNT